MTKTLKKQLFDSPIFFLPILLLPLSGFWLYAAYVDMQFMVPFLIVLSVLIALLVYVRRMISMIKAQHIIARQHFLEQANLLNASIDKGRQEIRAIDRKMIDYDQLKDIAEKLNHALTVHDASEILSEEVGCLFGEDDTTVILYLFHSKTGELGISASQKGQMNVTLKAKRGDLYDRWVAKNMQALLIENTKSDFRFDIDKVGTEDSRTIRSLMSVPMVIGNKAIGILRLDSAKTNRFHSDHIRLLTTIADLGAVAIENTQLYEHIEDLAIHDGLTGLFLRRHFLKRLSHEITRGRRKKSSLAFFMIDLDYFKKYNDQYGHMAGDIVLKTLSMILVDLFSCPGDMVCRYGGEEFAVFLPGCSEENALKLAQELRKRVIDHPVMFRRQKTEVTVSIGVSIFPDHAEDQDGLIEKADQALYTAKEKGRNRVCLAQ